MKKFILFAAALISSSALAGFTCIKGIQDRGILISSGGASIQMDQMDKCEEAVARAKNGFTCVEYISSAQLARVNGATVYMDSMEDCLTALEKSK